MAVALVTGACGFIGSHVCELLVRRGYDVIAWDRKTADRRWIAGLPVRFFPGDLTRPESIAEPMAQAELVFHLAAIVMARNLADFSRVNVEGTRHVVEAAARHRGRIRRFVYFSSLAARGPDGPQCRPVSEYGRSKLAGETVIREHAADVPGVILRMPAVYGPRDREFLRLIRPIKSGFWPARGMRLSMVFVEDAALAGLRLAELADPNPEACTVCDGQIYDFDDWARRVARVLGVRAVPVPVPLWLVRLAAWGSERFSRDVTMLNRDKVNELACRSWACDNAELERRVGPLSLTDLDTGLRRTIDWYRKEGWL